MVKTIGRDPSCDFVIFDPKNRVSRKHLEIHKNDGSYYIKDLNSLNGSYLNGKKIKEGNLIKINLKDKVTLSVDYPVEINSVFVDDDATRIITTSKDHNPTVLFDNDKAIFRDKDKTIVFDKNKTQLGDILQMDTSAFITVGRNPDNKIVINNSNISRYQCRMRLLTPVMFELEDLNSTNGSFVDNIKLEPNKRYQFDSSARVKFGNDFNLDLKSIFPNIEIIQKSVPTKPPQQPSGSNNNGPVSESELKSFNELEGVWKEYISRQNQANNAAMGYGIGGSVIGIVASMLLAPVTGGASIMAPIIGTAATAGGGVLGRYLGQQKSSQIRNDLTYEDAFLEVYSCPRCKESFQKKPWITIRECFKCKCKFK
jgi:pSer/pThr/pTyr-binding forkhead associated (FHA) protein/ribosomal protein L37AE/L43A